MLTIRDEQLSPFRELAVHRLTARMLEYLHQTYPARHAEWGDDGARRLVALGLDLSRRSGIDGVGGISVVIDLMARFGPHFEASGAADWVSEMLARRDLPPSVRIESIIKHLNAKTGGRALVAAVQPIP